MTTKIRLGISTCPNDTFAFSALINRQVDWRGLEFVVELLDIQQLNLRLFNNDFDVAKASFHAALLLADSTVVLPSGSALGFGVGPLLLAARNNAPPSNASQTTLCPGRHTTAALLFQLFYPHTTNIRHVVFSDIMPELKMQKADFGVCIHEGSAFAYHSFADDRGPCARWDPVSRRVCSTPRTPIAGAAPAMTGPYGVVAGTVGYCRL